MNTIVCISGTSRPNNYTSRALGVVREELQNLGHSTELFDARHMELSFPGNAPTDDVKRLKDSVSQAAAVVLATPEYHGTFAAMTKLILENMGFPSALSSKPVALVGVASGRIGAIKSLEHLRGTCAHMGAVVLPGATSISGVQSAFDSEGRCTDEKSASILRNVAHSLSAFMRDYVCPKYVLEEMVRENSEVWTSSV
jgi:chromate reductase